MYIMLENPNQPTIPKEAKMVLGGGGVYYKSARPLIAETGLEISGKSKPNVLIIPTPKYKKEAHDALVEKSSAMYRDDIGVNVDYLHGFEQMPDSDTLQDKFDKSDVIYICGGDTKNAMKIWKENGVDTMLQDAMKKGKVITGISAGALAWFQKGHSDSQSYEVAEGEPWDFMAVDGMGNINATATPHYNSTGTPDGRLRSEHFKDYLERNSTNDAIEYGIGIDNNAAILAVDGLMRVIFNKNQAGIYIAGSDRSEKELDAPKFHSDESIDRITSDGISWPDFYRQLKTKSK